MQFIAGRTGNGEGRRAGVEQRRFAGGALQVAGAAVALRDHRHAQHSRQCAQPHQLRGRQVGCPELDTFSVLRPSFATDIMEFNHYFIQFNDVFRYCFLHEKTVPVTPNWI